MERGRDKQTLLQGLQRLEYSLGCFTQTHFNKEDCDLCSLLYQLTSSLHLQGASSGLNILQPSPAVFKTTPMPSQFYKEEAKEKLGAWGILEVLDLNCLSTSGLSIKVFSDCCLCACLFTTLLYSFSRPHPSILKQSFPYIL